MRAWLPLVVALLRPVAGLAQCPAPQDLCTGDPCIAEPTEIVTPCTLDFGAAGVEIHAIHVTGSDTFTVRARTITVLGTVQARGVNAPTIELFADDTYYQRALIDVSASVAPGTIHVRAGGDATLDGKMRATVVSGAEASGGTIVVEAGGRIDGPGGFSHDVSGRGHGRAGNAIYHGDAGISLVGHLIMRGGAGGYAEFTSANGPVAVGTDVRSRMHHGPGASMVMDAGTDATVVRGLNCDGTSGGSLTVSGATVTLPKHEGLRARGLAGPGGTIVVTGGAVIADEGMSVEGSPGGTITVTGGSIAIDHFVAAGGRNGAAGSVSLSATGDLTLQMLADAYPDGTIDAHAGGDLVVSGAVRAGPDGCIGLSAGGTLSTAGAIFDVPVTTSCP